jgi:hypothetical protein
MTDKELLSEAAELLRQVSSLTDRNQWPGEVEAWDAKYNDFLKEMGK